ncbi:MAG: twin-arginine translocation signal domain-containing protein, partial [Verrucomicrobia bacterium]|nr:twin-arginine translocation signal domain-containing protein [Verrucomicrobiota bacterium]
MKKDNYSPRTIGRRQFLGTLGAGTAGMFLGGPSVLAAKPFPIGKADHCIMLWLGGGCCHIDTWDPQDKGDAKKRIAGSYYDAIPTAVDGIQVC